LATKMATKKEAPFIGAAVTELERAYTRLNKELFGSQLPARVAILIQSRGRRNNTLGWYWSGGWRNGTKGASPEITITAETLNRNDPKAGHSIGETLIHEMVHGLEQVLDVRGGRMPYHNKAFRDLAVASGLDCDDVADPRAGYGYTRLGDKGRKALAKIRFKWDLFNHRMVDRSGSKQRTKMIKWTCACQPRPTIVRCATELVAVCAICKGTFELDGHPSLILDRL
jgi:hypothetical protein